MRRRTRGRAGSRCALVVFAVLLASCGGGPSQDQGADAPPGVPDDATDGTTNGEDRETAALPPPGPVDPVFPPGTPAYELLAAGRCDELKAAVDGWGTEVVDVEGADTVELYRSAAHVCLGEWDEAIEAFGRITGAADPLRECPRERVFAWLAPLIAARQADPNFEPELVPGGGTSPCPAEPTVDATADGAT